MRAVAVLAVLPEYRRRFVEVLFASFDASPDHLQLVVGDVHLDPTVRSSSYSGVTVVRNFHLLGRRLLWQSNAIRATRGADVLVVDLNPRSLTAWVLLILGKLRKQRVLVWGHVLPRAGEDAKTMPLRRFMRRRAHGVISYTWTDAQRVLSDDPDARVWVAANGLYRVGELGASNRERANNILYVGRLEPKKKPQLAIDAFARASGRLPKQTRLIFVGTGSLEKELIQLAEATGVSARISFAGQIDSLSVLREIYAKARVAVSPGYVGLSLTQSLGFGVPMLVAENEPHAPEIELLNDTTGALFSSDDADDFAEALIREFSAAGTRRPIDIAKVVIQSYSADAMAAGFEAALRNVDPIMRRDGGQ